MKKLFTEFKKFITRGNVLDLAVGVIIGGAFTSIVNALTNNILKPLINWLLSLIFPGDGLAGAITILGTPVYTTDDSGNQILDLANTIHIDWGAFISAIINFFLIAIVLFAIIKTINTINETKEKVVTDAKEKRRERLYKKLLKKNEKLAKKGKEPLPIPEELLPPQPEEPVEEPEPEPDPQLVLLEEIRDLLKERK